MEITIKATPKEIADLVREVQSQQKATMMSTSFDITNRNTDDKDMSEKMADEIYSEMKKTKMAVV